MDNHDDCTFCRIIRGEIPAKFVYEDDTVVAFRDMFPVAPTHVLIVPRAHTDSMLELVREEDASDTMTRILIASTRIAEKEGILESGFRFIANVGPDGGQTIYHTHFHLIGGVPLGESLLPMESVHESDEHPHSTTPAEGHEPVSPIELPEPPGQAHV